MARAIGGTYHGVGEAAWGHMHDGTNGEKVHTENRNIEDLVKRKGLSDTSSTTALGQTSLGIGNGKRKS